MSTENIDYHIVKPGDTLATITAKTGVARAALVKYNPLDTIKKLNAGDVLYLNKETAFSVQVLFLDALRHPLENLVYRVEVDYKEITGKTAKNGLLDEFITSNARSQIQVYIKDLQGNWQHIASSVSDYGKKLITAVSPYLVFNDQLQPHPPRAPTTPEPPAAKPASVPKGKQPPLPAPPTGSSTPNNPHVKKRHGTGKHGESVIHLEVDLPQELMQMFALYHAAPITEALWERTANQLGCEVEVLKAFALVETQGDPYWRLNSENGAQIPNILYERHIFHINTKGIYDHDHADISWPIGYVKQKHLGENNRHMPDRMVEKMDIYPKAYGISYLRLIAAYRLNKNAALRACSWGMFQILGDSFHDSGLTSVDEFVKRMCTSESAQIKLLAQFIIHKNGGRLWTAIKVKNWKDIAYNYNGPSYTTNNYDILLHSAYEKIKNQNA